MITNGAVKPLTLGVASTGRAVGENENPFNRAEQAVITANLNSLKSRRVGCAFEGCGKRVIGLMASVEMDRTGREKLNPGVRATVTVPSLGQIFTTLSWTML